MDGRRHVQTLSAVEGSEPRRNVSPIKGARRPSMWSRLFTQKHRLSGTPTPPPRLGAAPCPVEAEHSTAAGPLCEGQGASDAQASRVSPSRAAVESSKVAAPQDSIVRAASPPQCRRATADAMRGGEVRTAEGHAGCPQSGVGSAHGTSAAAEQPQLQANLSPAQTVSATPATCGDGAEGSAAARSSFLRLSPTRGGRAPVALHADVSCTSVDSGLVPMRSVTSSEMPAHRVGVQPLPRYTQPFLPEAEVAPPLTAARTQQFSGTHVSIADTAGPLDTIKRSIHHGSATHACMDRVAGDTMAEGKKRNACQAATATACESNLDLPHSAARATSTGAMMPAFVSVAVALDDPCAPVRRAVPSPEVHVDHCGCNREAPAAAVPCRERSPSSPSLLLLTPSTLHMMRRHTDDGTNSHLHTSGRLAEEERWSRSAFPTRYARVSDGVSGADSSRASACMPSFRALRKLRQDASVGLASIASATGDAGATYHSLFLSSFSQSVATDDTAIDASLWYHSVRELTPSVASTRTSAPGRCGPHESWRSSVAGESGCAASTTRLPARTASRVDARLLRKSSATDVAAHEEGGDVSPLRCCPTPPATCDAAALSLHDDPVPMCVSCPAQKVGASVESCRAAGAVGAGGAGMMPFEGELPCAGLPDVGTWSWLTMALGSEQHRCHDGEGMNVFLRESSPTAGGRPSGSISPVHPCMEAHTSVHEARQEPRSEADATAISLQSKLKPARDWPERCGMDDGPLGTSQQDMQKRTRAASAAVSPSQLRLLMSREVLYRAVVMESERGEWQRMVAFAEFAVLQSTQRVCMSCFVEALNGQLPLMDPQEPAHRLWAQAHREKCLFFCEESDTRARLLLTHMTVAAKLRLSEEYERDTEVVVAELSANVANTQMQKHHVHNDESRSQLSPRSSAGAAAAAAAAVPAPAATSRCVPVSFPRLASHGTPETNDSSVENGMGSFASKSTCPSTSFTRSFPWGLELVPHRVPDSRQNGSPVSQMVLVPPLSFVSAHTVSSFSPGTRTTPCTTVSPAWLSSASLGSPTTILGESGDKLRHSPPSGRANACRHNGELASGTCEDRQEPLPRQVAGRPRVIALPRIINAGAEEETEEEGEERGGPTHMYTPTVTVGAKMLRGAANGTTAAVVPAPPPPPPRVHAGGSTESTPHGGLDALLSPLTTGRRFRPHQAAPALSSLTSSRRNMDSSLSSEHSSGTGTCELSQKQQLGGASVGVADGGGGAAKGDGVGGFAFRRGSHRSLEVVASPPQLTIAARPHIPLPTFPRRSRDEIHSEPSPTRAVAPPE